MWRTCKRDRARGKIRQRTRQWRWRGGCVDFISNQRLVQPVSVHFFHWTKLIMGILGPEFRSGRTGKPTHRTAISWYSVVFFSGFNLDYSICVGRSSQLPFQFLVTTCLYEESAGVGLPRLIWGFPNRPMRRRCDHTRCPFISISLNFLLFVVIVCVIDIYL